MIVILLVVIIALLIAGNPAAAEALSGIFLMLGVLALIVVGIGALIVFGVYAHTSTAFASLANGIGFVIWWLFVGFVWLTVIGAPIGGVFLLCIKKKTPFQVRAIGYSVGQRAGNLVRKAVGK